MKLSKAKLSRVFPLRGNQTHLFYILALAPLMLIFYYNPFSVVIPFYGFLLLFLKEQKLLGFEEASSFQRILGSIVVVASFFVYYGVVLIYPKAAFYSPANYTVYLLGLFLLLFGISALKEAFSPLFLIVAATSSSFIAEWLRAPLSPYANDIAHIVVNILRALSIDADIYYFYSTPILTVRSLSGRMVYGAFVYECMGAYSALVFSIILVVILFEDPGGLKVKLAYAVAGLLGTFFVNILRVTIILLADYFYGAEVGATIHSFAGYALFSVWLAFFFYVYSKRQTLHAKIASFWKKTP